MRVRWVVGAVVGTVLLGCMGGTEADRFDATADASVQLAEAVERAGPANKAVLLEVGGDWCSDTNHLDTIFESDPVVSTLLADHFELVRIYTGPDNDNAAFLSRYPSFDGVPHLFLLDREGKLTASLSAETLVTTEPVDEAPVRMAKVLEAWSSGWPPR